MKTSLTDAAESAHLDRPRGGLGMANWGDVKEAYNHARDLETKLSEAERERDEARAKLEAIADNVKYTLKYNFITKTCAIQITQIITERTVV